MFNQDCATLIQDFFQENCIQDPPNSNSFKKDSLALVAGMVQLHSSSSFQGCGDNMAGAWVVNCSRKLMHSYM